MKRSFGSTSQRKFQEKDRLKTKNFITALKAFIREVNIIMLFVNYQELINRNNFITVTEHGVINFSPILTHRNIETLYEYLLIFHNWTKLISKWIDRVFKWWLCYTYDK